MTQTHDVQVRRPEIEAFLNEMIREMGAEPADVGPDATLEDLGLDSLDVVELSQGVKKRFGIPVAPNDFEDAVTVNDAVELVLVKVGAA